ncbi:MAG: putative RNA uridine N3 methyltransferase [Candidatus Thorarchaeota archaeon]|nr:putative RNA uridine N3 methyltransferase [Candidatus Thorarchaeota archaeon]
MPLEIALSDTSLSDCADLRQKTIKIGQIARAIAVFKVDSVVIYQTNSEGKIRRDLNLLEKLLRYMDTPQYLRRTAFPMAPSLKYAGILPPLRMQSHPIAQSMKSVSNGDFRWGIQAGPGKVDIGLNELIDCDESISNRDPTLFKLRWVDSAIQLSVVERSSTERYFGFDVKVTDSLIKHLENSSSKTRIALSRTGVPYSSIESEIKSVVGNTRDVIAIIGGPRRGIRELFPKEKDTLKEFIDYWVNTIDDQGTETVRVEEAVWASLAMFNSSFGPDVTKPGYFK